MKDVYEEVEELLNPEVAESSDLFSIYADIANVIGIRNTEKLYELVKGRQISFPTRFYSTEYVAHYACQMYDGTTASLRKIAEKIGYTERRIRDMIKQENKRRTSR